MHGVDMDVHEPFWYEIKVHVVALDRDAPHLGMRWPQRFNDILDRRPAVKRKGGLALGIGLGGEGKKLTMKLYCAKGDAICIPISLFYSSF